MARYSPFSGIPLQFGGAVYAVELRNGMVKVGYSANPRVRMSTLNNQCQRIFRTKVARFHIGPNVGDLLARRIERAVLDRLTMTATVVRSHREFFLNVTFEEAVNLVQQMSAQRANAGSRSLPA